MWLSLAPGWKTLPCSGLFDQPRNNWRGSLPQETQPLLLQSESAHLPTCRKCSQNSQEMHHLARRQRHEFPQRDLHPLSSKLEVGIPLHWNVSHSQECQFGTFELRRPSWLVEQLAPTSVCSEQFFPKMLHATQAIQWTRHSTSRREPAFCSWFNPKMSCPRTRAGHRPRRLWNIGLLSGLASPAPSPSSCYFWHWIIKQSRRQQIHGFVLFKLLRTKRWALSPIEPRLELPNNRFRPASSQRLPNGRSSTAGPAIVAKCPKKATEKTDHSQKMKQERKFLQHPAPKIRCWHQQRQDTFLKRSAQLNVHWHHA